MHLLGENEIRAASVEGSSAVGFFLIHHPVRVKRCS
jgi:hypothetical protein